MSSLSPETRALIDAAGDADRPIPEERARLRAALVARLGIGAAVVTTTAVATNGAATGVAGASGATASAGAGAAAGPAVAAGTIGTATTAGAASAVGATKMAVVASTGLSVAMKALGVAVIASAATLTTIVASRPDAPAAPPIASSEPTASTPPTPGASIGATLSSSERKTSTDVSITGVAPATDDVPVVAPEPLPSVPRLISRTGRAESSARPPERPRTSVPERPAAPSEASTAREPAPPAPMSTAAADSTIAAETALLRRAHALLVSGDASGALALLDEHARTFPNAILVEEREAERVGALCAAGNVDEARAAATTFLAAHPGSALASRVRRTCEAR